MAHSISSKLLLLLTVVVILILLQLASCEQQKKVEHASTVPLMAVQTAYPKPESKAGYECEFYKTTNTNTGYVGVERRGRQRFAIRMALDHTWENYCSYKILHTAFSKGCDQWKIDGGDQGESWYPIYHEFICYDRFYLEPRTQLANSPLPDELPRCIFETLERLKVCFGLTANKKCVSLAEYSALTRLLANI